MWNLLPKDKLKLKLKDDEEVFFDKTQIVKVQEDWISKLDPSGWWSHYIIMEPGQAQDFEDARKRGEKSEIPSQLRLRYWRAVVKSSD